MIGVLNKFRLMWEPIQQSLMVRDAVPALMDWFHCCGPRQLIALESVDIHENDCHEINTELEKLLLLT